MLDFTTVFLYSGALTLFVCVVTGLAWWAGEPGSESRYWFQASILQLTGTLLMSLGDFAPLYITGYVSGVASTAATGFLALGYRKMFGFSASKRLPLAVAFITGTLIYLTKLFSHGHEDGIYLIYAGGSINLAYATHAVWKGAQAEDLRFGRVAAGMLAAYAATYAAVAPLAYLFPITFIDGKPHSFWLEASTIPLVLLNLGAYLMTLIVKLERTTEQQRHLASHDGLTGALNRAAFYDAWSREPVHNGMLAVLDLDHFKVINDTYGHNSGDLALQAFTRTITRELPRGATFARLGGEEFALLLPRFQRDEGEVLLDELRSRVAALTIDAMDGRTFRLTFSAGLAAFGEGKVDPDRTFAAADSALYLAKASGRDRVVVFDPASILSQSARHAPRPEPAEAMSTRLTA